MNKTNKDAQLLIRLSREELEQIQKNAKACDKTVSAFAREMLLNYYLIIDSFEEITEHTEQLAALRNVINRVVYTMQKDETCYPADIEYIINTMNEIKKSENEFLKEMRKYRASRLRELKITVEKTILNALKSGKKE